MENLGPLEGKFNTLRVKEALGKRKKLFAKTLDQTKDVALKKKVDLVFCPSLDPLIAEGLFRCPANSAFK